MQNPVARLHGRRILVVEGEYVLAEELRRRLSQHAADTVGPVPSVDEALILIDLTTVDAAILDINLDAEVSCPTVDALERKGNPFVFVSSVSSVDIPAHYSDRLLDRQTPLQDIAGALFKAQPC